VLLTVYCVVVGGVNSRLFVHLLVISVFVILTPLAVGLLIFRCTQPVELLFVW
jgi:hypothetical protein